MSLRDEYLTIKERHKDAIVMFQVGGFCQMLYNDALVAQRELGLKLLSRALGNGERAHMCGVPVARADNYALTLADRGYRVVLCLQTKDPETGAVGREVSQTFGPHGEMRDLTAEWEAYLAAPPPLPEREEKPRKASSGAPATLLRELRDLDVSALSPYQAMETLWNWKGRFCHDGLREDLGSGQPLPGPSEIEAGQAGQA